MFRAFYRAINIGMSKPSSSPNPALLHESDCQEDTLRPQPSINTSTPHQQRLLHNKSRNRLQEDLSNKISVNTCQSCHGSLYIVVQRVTQTHLQLRPNAHSRKDRSLQRPVTMLDVRYFARSYAHREEGAGLHSNVLHCLCVFLPRPRKKKMKNKKPRYPTVITSASFDGRFQDYLRPNECRNALRDWPRNLNTLDLFLEKSCSV